MTKTIKLHNRRRKHFSGASSVTPRVPYFGKDRGTFGVSVRGNLWLNMKELYLLTHRFYGEGANRVS